ncbi:MAG: hypothetical protein ACR5LG_13390 [Sodalis sp. (in: enterobacteria)]|uniref:hypothetical protein n=1 Tax=Sodalis sp. (in: enterobacteria) TaxID=1898979 RepID=UPI003F2A7E81
MCRCWPWLCRAHSRPPSRPASAGGGGYAQTLALFEAAASVAGEPDEAATNANDLLAELSSTNLKNNAKNLLIRGKGVDIQALMTQDAKAALTALDTLDRVIQLADRHDAQTKNCAPSWPIRAIRKSALTWKRRLKGVTVPMSRPC